MLETLITTTALSILLAGASLAQTEGTDNESTAEDNTGGEAPDTSEGETLDAPTLSMETWSPATLAAFFDAGDMTTLRDPAAIETSFTALSQSEQEQVRRECALLTNDDASGTGSDTMTDRTGDADAADAGAGSDGSATGTGSTDMSGGTTAASVSGETWTELCTIVEGFDPV